MKRPNFEKRLANDSSLYAQEGFNKDGTPKINHDKKKAFLAGADWGIDIMDAEVKELLNRYLK